MTFTGSGTTNAINTAGNLTAQDSLNEAQIWKAGADAFEETEDFLKDMEGGPDALIHTESSTAAGRGHQVHFRIKSGFYGQGLIGEELFAGDRELLEELKMGTESVRVDLLRNGIENFFLTEDGLGMRGELDSDLNEMMGAWMGREQSMQGVTSMIHQVSTDNHYFANGAGDMDGLRAGDTITMDDITTANAMLEPMGGRPAYLGRDGSGNPIRGACFLTTTIAAAGLKIDPDYKAAQRDSGVRGGENLIFKGGFSMVDGNAIRAVNIVDHDGIGAVGSPMNPKGFLGIKIVAGTGASMTATSGGRGICGGGDSASAAKKKIGFWRFFPKYAHKFVGTGGTLSTTASTHFLNSSGNFYVTIVNPANAPNEGAEVIRNKWGIFECSANDFQSLGNELTVAKRLAAAINGIAHTTCGNVTYNSAVNTETFVEGALVYLSNSYGVPVGRSIALYKSAMRRAFGKFRNKRMTDSREGGVVNELYIGSIFGNKPRENRRSKFPSIMVVNHAVTYPGYKHPTPT